MGAFMPELVIHQAWKDYWTLQDFHRQCGNESLAILTTGRQYQQAASHHGRDQSEVRATHRDIALQAQCVQVQVNHPFGAGVCRRRCNVFSGQPARAVSTSACSRVVDRHQADHLVTKQTRYVQVVGRRWPVAHHNVKLALCQPDAVVRVAGEWLYVHMAQRRLVLDLCHQLRQKQRVKIVTGRQAESRCCSARLKTSGITEQHFGRPQDACRGLDHAQAGVGGHHTGTRAHQQRVAGQLAQALERRADCGLVHPKANGGSRNAAFGQHGV